jgi:hypothetical protein
MRIVFLLALAALLPGCQLLEKLNGPSPPPASPAPPVVERSAPAGASSAEELVAYLSRLKSLSENALNAEANRQRQAAHRDPSDLSRVKAAMALTLSPNAEETDILALVDPLTKAKTDADVRAMASFLQGIALERRRLKESAAAAGARVRDAQKARDNEKQRADALQERAAQLQQKLDALTDIEKSLSDRTTPPR